MRWRLVLSVLVVVGLVAAACGDDSDGEASDDDTTTTEPSTTEPADDDTEEPADDDTDASTSTTTTEPQEPTASFRGVTEDTIRVGLTTFDWDTLCNGLNVCFGVTNAEDIYLAALEGINERGGINGRMLEFHTVNYLPVGTTAAEAACVELTQDKEVFVLVGTTLGDDILCYIDLEETAALVNGGMTDERKERARAPYATVNNQTEERSEAFVAAMDDLGLLEGRTIGVTGSIDVSETAFHLTVEALENAGYDPEEGLTGDNNENLDQSAREAELIYERFRAAGVDTTVSTTGVAQSMVNAVAAGWETDQWLLLTAMTTRSLRAEGVDPAYIDGAHSVSLTPIGTSEQEAMADDPLIAECVSFVEERTGRELPYDLDVEVSDIGQALSACSMATLLEAALTNAGVELTNDSFQAGLEAIGEIDLPGRSGSFMGPGDLSAARGFTPTRFDAETGVWVLLDGTY